MLLSLFNCLYSKGFGRRIVPQQCHHATACLIGVKDLRTHRQVCIKTLFLQ
jgi:hypothetical protein